MSSLALKLIAENRSSKATFLDLGNCGLTEIPAEVGELVWLEGLSLAGTWYEGEHRRDRNSSNRGPKNQVSGLGLLEGLTRLRALYLAGTQVGDLSSLARLAALQDLDVSDTKLTDLRPLARLSGLQTLRISRTGVSDLGPLRRLSGLRTLRLSSTGVTDLTPLAGLSHLQTLYLAGTQVSDLGPLAHVSGLQALTILGTRVSDLGPLAHVSGLQALSISSTPVSDLAPLARLSGLRDLDISKTKVSDLGPLAGLFSLLRLRLLSTQVRDLEPLARLSALQELEISDTKVSDLGPLAHVSGLKTLRVSRTQVSDLTPLMGLLGLQVVRMANTQAGDLAPLACLSALRELDISGTKVSDLGPLAHLSGLKTLRVSRTQVSDLTPLMGLSELLELRLSITRVNNLAPLAHLAELRELNVSKTYITHLIPLARLHGLQALSVSGTQVSDLTPLAGLSRLQKLYLASTPVNDLGPLAQLTGLKTLSLSSTKVSDLTPLIALIRAGLPVKWSSEPWSDDGIYVRDCPLTNPPAEIVAQGNEAILYYFAERTRGEVDHLYEAKMLILGEGGAGKTSLLRRLYHPGADLPTEKDTTKGIAIHKHEFKMKNGRTFRLNVWDFGGQHIYHATHQFFLTRRSLYVLVDDTRKDYKSVSDEGFRYWLELIEVFGGHSPILIFQNEKGGRSKAIDFGGIKQRYDNVKEVYAGNLDLHNVVDRARDGIEFYAANLSLVGEELPARWIKVREEIEALAAKQAYIPVEKYFEVYGQHIEFDEAKALLLSRYLHDVGAFLHFQDDPLLKRTVILRNQWATDAVFRILDDEAIKKSLGRFDREDCARLWKDSDYVRMHLELLALMQNFELCYELRDTKPSTWLAPQLLPPAKPKDLGTWAKPDDLVLRYKYDFLPKGIISRLTVRLHRFVRDPEKAWATGVLFERDHTAVLVEILPNGSEIELRARGPEHKTLLSIIAADLDALNDSFDGLRDKVDKRIPCNCKVCQEESTPWFFSHKDLLQRKERRRRTAECGRSYIEVVVLELLDGIKLESPPEWAKNDSGRGSESTQSASILAMRIFLASSSELREDRDQFDLYFRQLNDQLIEQGTYLQIVRWEYFLDAMADTRLQDEYNKAIRDCDVFVSLFFTKTGKFTEEEFDVAHAQFKRTHKPLIYTFFKNAEIKTASVRKEDLNSLWAFQEKLRKLGHFYTVYNNVEDLKLQFRSQLDRLVGQTHS